MTIANLIDLYLNIYLKKKQWYLLDRLIFYCCADDPRVRCLIKSFRRRMLVGATCQCISHWCEHQLFVMGRRS